MSKLLSVFGVLVCGTVLAEERVYPNADGSQRVDSAAAWGVESLDEIANDSLVFTNNTTLRIGGDWSFNGLSVQNRPPTRPWSDNINTVVFDATSEGETRTKLTKTGSDNTLLYSWTKSVYKGGDWDFGGKDIRYSGGSGDAIGHSVTLCDGATFSNVANFYLRYANNNAYVAKLTLDGIGTSLNVTGDCMLNYYFSASSGDELLVANGAAISVDTFDPHGGTALITGVGSSFTAKTRTWYDKAKGSKIVVADGATASLAQVRMGDEASSNGVLRITGAGTTVSSAALFCGCYKGESNRVEVTDEAVLTVNGSFYIGGDPWYKPTFGHGNELLVSNATVHVTADIYVGQADTADGNTVRLQGEAPAIVVDSYSTILQNKSRLVFDIPTNGYAATVVPLTVGNKAGSPLFDETSSLELNGVAALQSNLVRRTTYTLIRDGASNTSYTLAAIPESVLERARQSLPEKCTLKLSNDKRSLLLTVGALRGLILWFR